MALAGALVAPRKITNNGHRASAALSLDILGLTQRARAGPKLTGSLDIDPYCFVFAESRGAHEAVDTIDASFCFADWCTVSRRNRADLKTESNLWRAGGSVIWTDPECCCGADAASEGCAVPRSWGASVPSEPTESPLELAQIRYFVTLCRERNFTRAARRCGVSQPSLSNGIKALECELGGKLFERSDMSLTPLGKSLRLHFECAVASAGQITKRAKAFHRRQLARRRGAVVQSQPLLDPAVPLSGAQCFEEATQRPLSGLAGQAEPDAAASSLRIS